MSRPKNLGLNDIRSRFTAIRKERNLTRPQMAAELNVSSNNYNKYESGLYFPSFKTLAILTGKFDISVDWLIYNKGAMHFSTIEKALRENKQLKQDLQEASARAEAFAREAEAFARSGEQDAEIVTDPEIKELIRYLEDNPLFKYQLLIYFHRRKKGGQKTEEAETSPFE
jgi:transcriptional regulator with XRE-family HTH domain